MRSFKSYLIGAVVFAALMTALLLNKDVGAFMGKFDLFVFLPIMTGALVSGDVHALSEFGVYFGFFIEWFIIGVAVGAVVWLIARRTIDAAT